MAYLEESELEKQQKQQSGQAPASSENVISTENGTIGSAGGQASSASSNQSKEPAKSKSGSFTNLVNYVSANKGNDAQIGQRVGEVVGGTAQKATNSIQGYQNAANDAVNKGTVKDTGVIEAVKSAPQTVKKEDFQNQYNATYGGPNTYSEINGFDSAVADTNKVKNQVNQASGSLTDRVGLVKEAYKAPNYRQGEQTLDSFLLGAGDDGRKSLQDIQNNYSGFESNLDNSTKAVSGAIDQGRATTDATRTATKSAYDTTKSNYNNDFLNTQQAVVNQNQANAQKYQQVISNLNSKDPRNRAAAYQDIGMDTATGEWLRSKGYDAAKIINQSKAQSLGDVVKDDQVQKYQALLSLLDEQPGFDFTKAGGSANPFDVRSDQVNSATSARNLEANLDAKLSAAQKARQAELDSLGSEFVSFGGPSDDALRKLGISREDYNIARQNGIDPYSYVTSGGKLGYGNVADANTKAQYSALLNALGVKGYDLNAAGSDPSYSFDSGRFNSALSAAKQAIAQKAAQDATKKSAAGASDLAARRADLQDQLRRGLITGYTDPETGKLVT